MLRTLYSGDFCDFSLADRQPLQISSGFHRKFLKLIPAAVLFMLGAMTPLSSIMGQSTFMAFGTVTAEPGEDFDLPVLGDWTGNIAGFSFSAGFSGPTPFPLENMIVDVEGTLAGAITAEYVQEQIDMNAGTVICGVLFDALPPFNGQTLPSLGFVQEIAFIRGSIKSAAQESIVNFVLQDGYGSPPINNLMVFGTTSIPVDLLSPGSVEVEIVIPPVPQLFIRGDVNMDGLVDIADVIFHLDYTFLSGPLPACMDAGDANDDGVSDISDAIFLLYWFFLDGPGPWIPFPNPGEDFTADNLDCAQGL